MLLQRAPVLLVDVGDNVCSTRTCEWVDGGDNFVFLQRALVILVDVGDTLCYLTAHLLHGWMWEITCVTLQSTSDIGGCLGEHFRHLPSTCGLGGCGR